MVNKIKSKEIIELEAIFKHNFYYVFRADGVDFKEFRVSNLDLRELKSLYQVYFKLSKLLFKQFQWIKIIYFFDDEINLAYRGSQIGMVKEYRRTSQYCRRSFLLNLTN